MAVIAPAAPTSRTRTRGEEPEWVVLLVVLGALLAGFFLQFFVLTRLATVTVGGMSVSYPASWSQTSREGALFAATESEFASPFAPRLAVYQIASQELLGPAGGTAYDVATSWVLRRTQELQGYRSLGLTPAEVNGREAYHVEGAYLANPMQGSASLAMPALMRTVDTIVVQADQVYVLSFAAEPSAFARLTEGGFPRFRDMHQAILQSWRLP